MGYATVLLQQKNIITIKTAHKFFREYKALEISYFRKFTNALEINLVKRHLFIYFLCLNIHI